MNSKKVSLAILKVSALAAMASMYLLSICYRSAEFMRNYAKLAIAQIEKEETKPIPTLPQSIQLPNLLTFLPKHQAIINQLPRQYLTVKHLKHWAKAIRVRGYSKMVKSELITLLTPTAIQPT
jgi:hypothetical protein